MMFPAPSFSIGTTMTCGAEDDEGAVVVVIGGLVVVVGAAVVVVVGNVPPLPPKSLLNAARALGKLPSVMSLSCPPAVSLNEKMSVNATLLVEIQLANWLMKYGSSPSPCPSLRKHTDHSGIAMGLPCEAAKLVSQLRPQLWVRMLLHAFCGVWGVPQYSS